MEVKPPAFGDHRHRILIVDDEPDIRRILEVNLKAHGYEVLTAAGGEEGMLLARERRPGLVLLDMMMPGMSGLEVLARLQADEDLRKVPVIILSARDGREHILEGLQAGAVDYVVKPFETRELLARIASQFKIQGLYREIESHARRVEQDLELARSVQESILPHHTPYFAGVNLSATYLATEKVGGDFYDILRISDHDLAIVLTDVSGHGIAAAFLTAMAKMSFKKALREGRPLNEVLDEVNADFVDILRTDHFLTAFVGVYNSVSGVLRYAKAGHVEQFLFTEGGRKVLPLGTRGMILGVFEHGDFEEKQVILGEGDKLVLFTDGLVEARNAVREQYGAGRFRDFVAGHWALDPASLIDAVMEDQDKFLAGRPRMDDLSVVVMEVSRTSVMEQVKSLCGFGAEVQVMEVQDATRFRATVMRMTELLETKGAEQEMLRDLRVRLEGAFYVVLRNLDRGRERLRAIWQYEGGRLLMAFFLLERDLSPSRPGEGGRLQRHLQVDSSAPLGFLHEVFDTVEFLRDGEVLKLAKERSGESMVKSVFSPTP